MLNFLKLNKPAAQPHVYIQSDDLDPDCLYFFIYGLLYTNKKYFGTYNDTVQDYFLENCD